MCHFPFRYKNVTYASCARVKIPEFNIQGEPWCATEVNPEDDLTVLQHKWAVCQDERGVIIDGDGMLALSGMGLANIYWCYVYLIMISQNKNHFRCFIKIFMYFDLRCGELLSNAFCI